MKRVISFIYGVMDLIKEFLVNWGIKILIVLFIGMILHNILKIAEFSTVSPDGYKNLVVGDFENNKMMNVYVAGSGEKTIVILPGFGSQSPVLQYKALVDGLKDEYRVVVVEYYGYGFSMGNTKSPRTNQQIAIDTMTALKEAGIDGEFYLMPHSISNMYAMKIQSLYPEKVRGIISIDGEFPAEIDDPYYMNVNADTVTNVNLTSILELSGFERVLSLVSPKTFYIDKMQEMKNVYTSDDITLYKNRIANSYLTRTMVNEINKMIENKEELKEYKYPANLPVMQILSQDRVNEYKTNMAENGAKVDLDMLAEGVVTNKENQKTVVIKGDHMLQFTNPKGVIDTAKSFLASY